MKYAVEARVFGPNKIVPKLRKAFDGEENSHYTTECCEVWIDIFDDEHEARTFYNDYRKS
jgi:hypothetical protein